MSRSLADSFAVPDAASLEDDDDDVTSLPSTSTESFESYDDRDAQLEWERSLQQLELLLTMVLVPFVGKYFGRKFAFWTWGRYMEWQHGVEIRWTNKRAFQAAGVVGAAATL